MGKNYYCDYCNKSFGDKASNRSKHLNSMQHKNARTKHYKLFENPIVIIQNEYNKKPCNEFYNKGKISLLLYIYLTMLYNNM